MNGDLSQSSLETEFPGWKFWRGPNGLPYAQKAPPARAHMLWGESWAVLRDKVLARERGERL